MRKIARAKLDFSLLQTFHSKNYDSINTTSVIEIADFKVCFGFFVDTRKYIGKNNTHGDDSIMSNEVILNFMSYSSIII